MFAKKRLSDEVARLSSHLAQGGGGVGVAVDVAKPDAKLPVKNLYPITLFSRLRVSKQILNSALLNNINNKETMLLNSKKGLQT